MFPKSAGRIVEALLKIPGVDDAIAQEVADSLSDRDQDLEHHGSVTIKQTLPSRDRDYSAHVRPGHLHPVPPVDDPSITGSLLTLDNLPIGNSDRRGDNGFALTIPHGILRNQGESWIVKHAYIDNVTTVADTRSTKITTSNTQITVNHYCADGYECGDSKGRDLTDIPIRVFYPTLESLPTETSVISYVRDQSGLPTPVGPSGTEDNLQWAVATTAWTWHNETARVGVSVFNAVNDHHSVGTSAVTTRIYLSGTPHSDPNVQVGDRIGWVYDNNSERTAVIGHEDAVIGDVIMTINDPADIRKGWVQHGCMDGRFPVGYDGAGDYAAIGNQGGSHPIRPKEHSSADSDSSTSTWNGSTAWFDTAWTLIDHPSTSVSEEEVVSSALAHTSPATSTVAGITNITVDTHVVATTDVSISTAGIVISSSTASITTSSATTSTGAADSATIPARPTLSTTSTGLAASTTDPSQTTQSTVVVGAIDFETIPATTTVASVSGAGLSISSEDAIVNVVTASAVVTVLSTTIAAFASGGFTVDVNIYPTGGDFTSNSSTNLVVHSAFVGATAMTINTTSLTIEGSATAASTSANVVVANHTSHTHAAVSISTPLDYLAVAGFTVPVDDTSININHPVTPNGLHDHTLPTTSSPTGTEPDHPHIVTIEYGMGTTNAWGAVATADEITQTESHTLVHNVTDDVHSHAVSATGLTIADHGHGVVIGTTDTLEHTHTVSGLHQHEIDPHNHTGWSSEHAHTVFSTIHDHQVTIGGHEHNISQAGHSHTATGTHQHDTIETSHAHDLQMEGHVHQITGANHSHDIDMDSHLHQIAATSHIHDLTLNSHSHTFNSSSHNHTIDDDGHIHEVSATSLVHVVQESSHVHTMASSTHTHLISTQLHNHTTPTLIHTGEFYHREEDFRPPYCTILFIRRVGPDDD